MHFRIKHCLFFNNFIAFVRIWTHKACKDLCRENREAEGTEHDPENPGVEREDRDLKAHAPGDEGAVVSNVRCRRCKRTKIRRLAADESSAATSGHGSPK
jgi:hypothetical protein